MINLKYKKLGKNLGYYKILLPFLLFILAFMIIFVVSYNKTAEEFRIKEVEKYQNSITSAIKYIDNDFLSKYYSLSSAIDNVAVSSSVKNLFSDQSTEDIEIYREAYSVFNNVARVLSTSDLCRDTMIVSNGYKMIGITSNNILFDLESLNEKALFDIGPAFEKFTSEQNSLLISQGFSPAYDVTVLGETYNAIAYVTELSSFKTDDRTNSLYGVLFLDTNEIIEQLLIEDGLSLLSDDSNFIISVLNGDDIIYADQNYNWEQDITQDSTYTTLEKSSELLGLTFRVSVPDNVFKEHFGYLNYFYFACIALILIISLLFILAFVKFIYLPLKNISGHFNSSNEKNGFLGLISRGIEELSSANTSLQETIDSWSPVVMTEYINRLLKGDVMLESELEILGIGKPDEKYCVGVFCLGNTNVSSSEYCIEAIKKACLKEFSHTLIYPISRDGYVCINKISNMDTKQVIHNKFENILANLSNDDLNLTIGVGQIVSDINQIYISYEKAYEASILLSAQTSDTIIWYDELDEDSQNYFFSYTNIEKIYYGLLSNNIDVIENTLDQVLALNNRNDQSILNQLFFDLKGIVLRVSLRTDIEDILKDIPQTYVDTNKYKFVEYWKKLLINIATSINDNKPQEDFISEVMKYIEENYTNPNISLNMVSSNFNLTAKYFSTLFKEKTGFNFSNYLEEKRIILSEQLLAQDTYTINEVSQMVGYLTVSTFYKAFKRKNGITPAKFKCLNKVNN